MKSVLVIGMGRFGRHLAHKMQELGNEVMVVDKEPARVDSLAADFVDTLMGDCTNEGVLRALGVKHFDVCFVSIGEDFQSSLVITSLLKKLGARHVVAKANQDIQAELLKKIGADEVVYPEREIAEKVAVRYNVENVFDYIQLTSDYSIYEVPVPRPWHGKTIMDLQIRNKYAINIIAVKNGNLLSAMPGAGYRFTGEEHIVVMGKSDDVFKLSGK